jgi:hypothetical protein
VAGSGQHRSSRWTRGASMRQRARASVQRSRLLAVTDSQRESQHGQRKSRSAASEGTGRVDTVPSRPLARPCPHHMDPFVHGTRAASGWPGSRGRDALRQSTDHCAFYEPPLDFASRSVRNGFVPLDFMFRVDPFLTPSVCFLTAWCILETVKNLCMNVT